MALHPDDERALDFTFAPNDYADECEHKIATALGLDVNAIRALEGAMVADLQWPDHSTFGDVERVEIDADKFGISWWKDYSEIGAARRVLVADYLIQTTGALETNLLEARLHLSAVRASLDAAPKDGPERPLRPMDLLSGTLAQLHIAGMLRAIGSAVDCMGAVAIGVLGLPLRIKRDDYGSVKRWVADRVPNLPPTPALTFQVDTLRAVFAAYESLTPEGWLDWATSFRHTYVHRGRRHQAWHPDVGLCLPAQPDRSELESRLASPYPEALHEPCIETLSGVMQNAERGTFQACVTLLAAWQHRRAIPTFIAQPRRQWTDDPPINAGASFAGFAPRELGDVHVAVMSPTDMKRVMSTAQDRRLKHLWSTWT